MTFSLEASFDSVRGHEIAHQGLRLASILLPLGAYIGPLQMALRIGNFVVPCLGKYLGAFDSKQLTTELGDRFEATELEYMPDNYQDIRSGKR